MALRARVGALEEENARLREQLSHARSRLLAGGPRLGGPPLPSLTRAMSAYARTPDGGLDGMTKSGSCTGLGLGGVPPGEASGAGGALTAPAGAARGASGPAGAGPGTAPPPLVAVVEGSTGTGAAGSEGSECSNCGRVVPAAALVSHQAHCARNNRRCTHCSAVVPARELEAHIAAMRGTPYVM